MMDIEQYLRDNKPEMPEEGQFLVETNARLRNVEGVKKCVDEDLRRGVCYHLGCGVHDTEK